ncbi:AMP-binding protein [Xanthobacter sp. VTT E-85241]|uniref:AMP-binding protein n=1 Tax=Roseixanthobacter finlandensis TaxID=3119922 RepID=UPI003728451B
MSMNLHDFLFPPALPGTATALTIRAGDVWSRARLADLAGRIAAVLRAAGVSPGDRVAAQVEKSAPAVALYLACLKAGAIYLPLNTAYTPHEMAAFLGDAEPAAFVGQPQAMAALAPHLPVECARFTLDAAGGGSLSDAAEAQFPLVESVPCGREDLAAILYTSGTTGRAKGAMITHGNLIHAAEALNGLWGITGDDVLLHALPVFHAHGLFIAINCALSAGAPMWFLPKFAVDPVIELLPRSTLFMGVPTLYTRLLGDPRLTRDLCGHMRLFTSGSAPLSGATFDAFRDRTGHAILERYGTTETAIIASNPLVGARIQGTVGFAVPGVDVRIFGELGQEMPRGDVGEVVLRGPNVFAGYWRMPEQSEEAFTPDGFFRTGDLARMDEDGRITIVGRAKDLIISGGYNVYPREVEAALARLDGVEDCAVIGVPHPDFGEGVIAIVERTPGRPAPDPAVLLSGLSAELARYKLPKHVIVQDTLPRNAMGKVQKTELRRIHADIFQGGGAAG